MFTTKIQVNNKHSSSHVFSELELVHAHTAFIEIIRHLSLLACSTYRDPLAMMVSLYNKKFDICPIE